MIKYEHKEMLTDVIWLGFKLGCYPPYKFVYQTDHHLKINGEYIYWACGVQKYNPPEKIGFKVHGHGMLALISSVFEYQGER